MHMGSSWYGMMCGRKEAYDHHQCLASYAMCWYFFCSSSSITWNLLFLLIINPLIIIIPLAMLINCHESVMTSFHLCYSPFAPYVWAPSLPPHPHPIPRQPYCAHMFCPSSSHPPTCLSLGLRQEIGLMIPCHQRFPHRLPSLQSVREVRLFVTCMLVALLPRPV